jgi:hypothetical protein
MRVALQTNRLAKWEALSRLCGYSVVRSAGAGLFSLPSFVCPSHPRGPGSTLTGATVGSPTLCRTLPCCATLLVPCSAFVTAPLFLQSGPFTSAASFDVAGFDLLYLGLLSVWHMTLAVVADAMNNSPKVSGYFAAGGTAHSPLPAVSVAINSLHAGVATRHRAGRLRSALALCPQEQSLACFAQGWW